MRKKLYLVFVLAMVLSLLVVPAAFAQEDDGTTTTTTQAADEDLVRVEVRNRTDQSVFIVLTTSFLPQGAAPEEGAATAGNAPFSGSVSRTTASLIEDVGTESGRTRFFGLALGPDSEQTFTVERGVYFHRTTACGETRDGILDVTSQVRLVFVPCGSTPVNLGEATMQKIAITDEGATDATNLKYHFQ